MKTHAFSFTVSEFDLVAHEVNSFIAENPNRKLSSYSVFSPIKGTFYVYGIYTQ